MRSPNHHKRSPGQVIDMVVLHYTGMRSGAAALSRLCDPAAKVSAHYLVMENGAVEHLVDEDHQAWHAGVAYWHHQRNINDRSIGIELVNPGHEWGYRSFPEAQMRALEDVLDGILGRHAIAARDIVGHADIAPTRKRDPGELFDWQRLARAGFGLWPGTVARDEQPAQPTHEGDLLACLAAYGYQSVAHPNTAEASAVITAFERHFRPWKLSGRADGENLQRCLQLLDQAGVARPGPTGRQEAGADSS